MSDEKLLSDDEMDALLDKSDDVDGQKQTKSPIAEIDFANQERIVHGQFPLLERIHERLGKRLSMMFYDLLSQEIEVQCAPLKVEKHMEYMCGLENPTGINIFNLSPWRGKALIVFKKDLINTLVDLYFGGNGVRKLAVEEREFTTSEIRVMDVVLNNIIKHFTEAWTSVVNLEPKQLNFEMNPQLVSSSSPNDVMIISAFTVKFAKSEAEFHIVIPYMMLEPIKEQLGLGSTRSEEEIDPNWSKLLKEEVLECPLSLSSILVKAKSSLRAVMSLKSGDIIPVEMPDTISLDVEGIPMYKAKYGVSQDKCALKIIQKLVR